MQRTFIGCSLCASYYARYWEDRKVIKTGSLLLRSSQPRWEIDTKITGSSGLKATRKVCAKGNKNSGERTVPPGEAGEGHRQRVTSEPSLQRKQLENKQN